MTTLIVVAVLITGAIVAGILIGRKNKKTVDNVVNTTNEVVKVIKKKK